jgi:peptide/nickel transport system substrate-binding protein
MEWRGNMTRPDYMDFDGFNKLKLELRRAQPNRREFMNLAIGAGISATVAEAMLRDAKAAPKTGGAFRAGIGWGSTSDTLDPALIVDSFMGTVNLTIRSTLAEVTTTGDIGGDIAESFEPSDQAKTWVVKIRKGVTFHNGKNLTLDDVIASVRHHMGSNTKSALKAITSQIEEVKADGDNLIFTLKSGNADFAYVLAEDRISIMPAKGNGDVDWQSGIGTGPYMLKEFKPGQRVQANRYPNYHGSTWLDEVELLSIIDPTARTNALLSRQIDYMDRPDPRILKYLEQNSALNIDKITGYEHNVFSMNVTVPPFDNPDIRNALKFAIDREAIVKQVFGGLGTIGNDNPVPPSAKFWINPKPVHKYDPELARSLLKKAGAPNLKISLSAADAAFTGAVDAASIFKENAAAAGIDITVIREPNDGYFDNVWLKKPFIADEWTGRPNADGILSFAYAADSDINETFWKNPRFNQLLTAARSELDDSKRAAMYAECQQLVHDDGGVIVLMFTTYVSANSKKFDHGPLLASSDQDGFRIAQRWWAT